VPNSNCSTSKIIYIEDQSPTTSFSTHHPIDGSGGVAIFLGKKINSCDFAPTKGRKLHEQEVNASFGDIVVRNLTHDQTSDTFSGYQI